MIQHTDPAGLVLAGHPSTHTAPAAGLWLGWLRTGVILFPVLLAIWVVPGFTTQDGPAHAYNAWILTDSLASGSGYTPYFEGRWQPLPNWAGHLAFAGLFQLVSPRTADRILMSLTLAGFAASMIWLRWSVAGGTVPWTTCLLSALLALNYLWLLGFTSFLLGACLYPVTLGVWWAGRDRSSGLRLACLSALLLLGYFCHLVSLGLTVLGLIILAVLAPLPDGAEAGWTARFLRLGRMIPAFVPLLPLGLVYLRLSRQGGPMRPQWENLKSAWSPAEWAARLGWVDPLTLAMKDVLPFTEQPRRAFALFAPVVWLSLAFMFWWGGRLDPGGDGNRAKSRTQTVWLGLAALMVLAGILGPDSLGPGHGEYLPQRLVLFGLVALIPAFEPAQARPWRPLTCACLLAAVTIQSVIVWDYAIASNRTAGQMIAARDLTGRGQRIATLLNSIGSHFRVNALLHADCWLGVGTGNVIWSNYETRHYYFPVQFRAGVDRPDSSDLEWLAIADGKEQAEDRAERWEQLLARHSDAIDEVVVWKSDPALDAITERDYQLEACRGDIRVYRRREIVREGRP